jgi:hypothetical protein
MHSIYALRIEMHIVKVSLEIMSDRFIGIVYLKVCERYLVYINPYQ